MARCRRAQVSGGSVCPRGSRSRQETARVACVIAVASLPRGSTSWDIGRAPGVLTWLDVCPHAIKRRDRLSITADTMSLEANNGLKVLSLVSAHNSLSQRAYIALTELGHDVTVEVVSAGQEMEAAVAAHQPELIVCPMLKTFIPEKIWREHKCLVLHPGPQG